ncbi:hypothetical protein AABM27_14440 [Heyndrickxia faecalis]|nr:hypothetical protein [Heyndrickxia coagulans]APB37272.1 hypothetical protein BIZ35_10985 [Heyndrickxia coagulans]
MILNRLESEKADWKIACKPPDGERNWTVLPKKTKETAVMMQSRPKQTEKDWKVTCKPSDRERNGVVLPKNKRNCRNDAEPHEAAKQIEKDWTAACKPLDGGVTGPFCQKKQKELP